MTWLWIPITLAAALLQTARNTAQRGLIKTAGTLGATLVRFLYGLPFAAAWLLFLHHTWPQPGEAVISAPFLMWIVLGALAQLFATALLLLAMQSGTFAVATAFVKTEVLQVALFAFVLIGERLGPGSITAIALSVAGVMLMSYKPGLVDASGNKRSAWWSTTAFYGIGSGALFALSAVGYRGAALLHTDWSPFYSGAYNLVWAQAIQTVLLGGWLLARDRPALLAAMREWRLSLAAGALGATSSIGWFTAFAMRSAADVRALSLIEVLFGYLVSHRLKEKTERREVFGMVLLVLGLVVLVLSA